MTAQSAVRALGIIPARYGSTRFPGKPLIDIAGKTMIQRVYEQALKTDLDTVIIATDDERIENEARRIGANVVMTAPHHQSGTDRCQQAYEIFDEPFDVVVNVQGDEPFIRPEQINQLIACFQQPGVQIATLVKKAAHSHELFDPNRVKVVKNSRNEALYFSRSPLPFQKDKPQEQWLSHYPYFIHIGLYAYRPHILHELAQLQPSPLEKSESLEQLRWLEHGYRIKLTETDLESDAIDHPDDLKKMLERIDKGDYIY